MKKPTPVKRTATTTKKAASSTKTSQRKKPATTKPKAPAAPKKKAPGRKKTRVKIKPAIVKRVAPAAILKVFAEVFNFGLDEMGMPKLNHGRQRLVAERYKVSLSAARKWLLGDSLPDIPNLIVIADDIGYSVDTLIGRKPFTYGEREVTIPIKREGVSGTASKLSFEDSILDTSLRSKHNNLEIRIVNTDSMAPNINVDDMAFVDTSIEQFEENKIYLFQTDDNRSIIRRVMAGLGNSVTLIADNPAYKPMQVNKSQIVFDGERLTTNKKLRVVGQISWAIKRMSQLL